MFQKSSARDVNKATGSKAKAPSFKTKACQLNPRPGQGHSWTRPIIFSVKEVNRTLLLVVSDVRILVIRTKILNTVK